MRVTSLPDRARVVVIGAGIVGNSMAYHLAQQGWKEIVLIDKGRLPNPGGSTGHASNFIFLTDHSKEMTLFTLDSVRQYKELGFSARGAASRSPGPPSGWGRSSGARRSARPGASMEGWGCRRRASGLWPSLTK